MTIQDVIPVPLYEVESCGEQGLRLTIDQPDAILIFQSKATEWRVDGKGQRTYEWRDDGKSLSSHCTKQSLDSTLENEHSTSNVQS